MNASSPGPAAMCKKKRGVQAARDARDGRDARDKRDARGA